MVNSATLTPSRKDLTLSFKETMALESDELTLTGTKDSIENFYKLMKSQATSKAIVETFASLEISNYHGNHMQLSNYLGKCKALVIKALTDQVFTKLQVKNIITALETNTISPHIDQVTIAIIKAIRNLNNHRGSAALFGRDTKSYKAMLTSFKKLEQKLKIDPTNINYVTHTPITSSGSWWKDQQTYTITLCAVDDSVSQLSQLNRETYQKAFSKLVGGSANENYTFKIFQHITLNNLKTLTRNELKIVAEVLNQLPFDSSIEEDKALLIQVANFRLSQEEALTEIEEHLTSKEKFAQLRQLLHSKHTELIQLLTNNQTNYAQEKANLIQEHKQICQTAQTNESQLTEEIKQLNAKIIELEQAASASTVNLNLSLTQKSDHEAELINDCIQILVMACDQQINTSTRSGDTNPIVIAIKNALTTLPGNLQLLQKFQHSYYQNYIQGKYPEKHNSQGSKFIKYTLNDLISNALKEVSVKINDFNQVQDLKINQYRASLIQHNHEIAQLKEQIKQHEASIEQQNKDMLAAQDAIAQAKTKAVARHRTLQTKHKIIENILFEISGGLYSRLKDLAIYDQDIHRWLTANFELITQDKYNNQAFKEIIASLSHDYLLFNDYLHNPVNNRATQLNAKLNALHEETTLLTQINSQFDQAKHSYLTQLQSQDLAQWMQDLNQKFAQDMEKLLAKHTVQ
jgi:hypothetical protein